MPSCPRTSSSKEAANPSVRSRCCRARLRHRLLPICDPLPSVARVACCAQRSDKRGVAERSQEQGAAESDEVELWSEEPGWRTRELDALAATSCGMPWRFISAVSTFGLGYLTWSKVSHHAPACPLGGCGSILSSSYSQVGPIPLSAFGALGYGTIATAALLALYLRPRRGELGTRGAAAVTPQRADTLFACQQAVLYGSSLLAGTSVALAATILTKFRGEFCAYCAASITSSLALYGAAYTGCEAAAAERGGEGVNGAHGLGPIARPVPRWSFGSFVIATLAVTTLFATYPDTVTAGSSYELPFREPLITAPSPPAAKALAARLRDSGAAMYGAFWCTHCAEQKEAFGASAVGTLPYVECYPDGYKGAGSLARACVDADVHSFPTWLINGERLEGDFPLGFLEAVLNGEDPAQAAKRY